MKKSIVMILAVSAVAVSMAACSQNRQEILSDRVREFSLNYKWGKFQLAGECVIEEKRVEFLKKLKGVEKDLTIEDYTVTKVDYKPGDGKARVLFEMKYLMMPDTKSKSRSGEQEWVWDRETWYLKSGY